MLMVQELFPLHQKTEAHQSACQKVGDTLKTQTKILQ